MTKITTHRILNPLDPLYIVTSKSPFFFFIGDLGTTVATGVSNWADQSGNGITASQGTAASQPSLIINDSDFGGRNSLLGDGVNDTMLVSWDPPAPGTTPVWFFAVFKQVSYTTGVYLFAGGNQVLAVAQTPSTPTLRQLNTTAVNANNGATIGTSVRLEALFNNNTTDYLKCGSSTVTGANAGNSDATTFFLFARSLAAGFGNTKIACIGAWNGNPTINEKLDLDAWVTRYYGSSVIV